MSFSNIQVTKRVSGATSGPWEPGPSLFIFTSHFFQFIILVKRDFHALITTGSSQVQSGEAWEEESSGGENSRSRKGAERVGCERTRGRQEKAKAAKVSGIK